MRTRLAALIGAVALMLAVAVHPGADPPRENVRTAAPSPPSPVIHRDLDRVGDLAGAVHQAKFGAAIRWTAGVAASQQQAEAARVARAAAIEAARRRQVIAASAAPAVSVTAPPRPPPPPPPPSGCMAHAAKSVYEAHTCWDHLIAKYPWPQAKAFSVMYCESRGDPWAYNPSSATGLMQILHGPFDPEANMATAYQMYAQRGWSPWVCA